MKTRHTYTCIAVALLMASALGSCTRGDELLASTDSTAGTPIRIIATMPEGYADGSTQTRVLIDEDGDGSFETGDEIILYEYMHNNYSNLNSDMHTVTLTYNGSSWTGMNLAWDDLGEAEEPLKNFYVFQAYHSLKGVTLQDGKDIVFSVEADQSSDENYRKSDLLYAKQSYYTYKLPEGGKVKLTFTHITPRIKVVLTDGTNQHLDLAAASVTLKNVKTGLKVAIDKDHKSPFIAAGAATAVKMKSMGNGTFYALLPPQQFDPDRLKVSIDIGGKTIEYTDSDVNFYNLFGETQYTLNLTLKE